MKYRNIYISLIVLLTLLIFDTFTTFNRSLFFRASSFYGEPRLEWPLLTTLETQLSGGYTHSMYDNCSNKKSLFNLYKSFNKQDEDFFKCKKGSFETLELDINYWQNLFKGFFYHFHIPFIQVNTSVYDRISVSNYKNHGLSDSTLFLGWGINYENTEYIDYIDFSAQLGVLFPSGKKITKNRLSMPLGYNGHWGLPVCFDLSFGAYNWFTAGVHLDGVFLKKGVEPVFDKCETICLNVKPGNIWRVGSYLKADHFIKGASLLFGVDYERHHSADTTKQIKLSNIHLRPWNRVQLHILAEYDFALDEHSYPRVGVCYNRVLKGRNILDTSILDGYLGIDFNWDY